ncbi:MAG: MarR family transcriptional regulator [Acidimicrobiia bacterium]|nr:MarR family transcriptional regulator [Acidimicrobiia bacterium]
MAPCGPTFLDGYLPYVLRRADQTLSAGFYATLTRLGVARSEWRVLAVLHELGELPVVDLAAAALSPQPTVTHALRRLEQRQLVARTPGRHDRRQRLVSLTAAGAELTAALIAEATRLEADALADADAGDLCELVERLRALTAHVQQRLERRAEPAVAASPSPDADRRTP